MTSTTERISPIIFSTYGDSPMPRALVQDLAEKIDAYDGNDRERMVMLTCWNWFAGGDTAASAAARIEDALA